jgi:hypothetical protein
MARRFFAGPRGSRSWWAGVVVHNVVVHPLLPLAEVLDLGPTRKLVASLLFDLHDATFPTGAG